VFVESICCSFRFVITLCLASAVPKSDEATTARLKRLAKLAKVKKAKAWEKHIDEGSGNPYWYNKETGESTWEDPTVAATDAA
jgi:hypothetical protein